MHTERAFRPGQYFHVFGRGVGKRDIFTERRESIEFLWLLKRALERHDVACAAFALMPNHYHLLLRPRSGSISQLMHGLLSSYARWFNARHDRSGPLFSRPYKARPIRGRGDLIDVVAYIHLNPFGLDTGLPTSDEIYRGDAPSRAWLDHEPVLARFGGTEAYVAYMSSAEALRSAKWAAARLDD